MIVNYKTDGNGRVISVTTYPVETEKPILELPDDFNICTIHDYVLVDGELHFVPLPEQPITPVAPRNITKGEYITVSGVMYKATSNIPNGEPIINGQNAIATTIEEQLAELAKGE